jgi:hypothetical protein
MTRTVNERETPLGYVRAVAEDYRRLLELYKETVATTLGCIERAEKKIEQWEAAADALSAAGIKE